jgi:3-isopropylmalate/(R)-2-methylmalate dehydratase large subunit
MGYTFAEKIFNAPAGAIVFRKPDIILTHDNSSSIYKTFQKMNGRKISDPEQLIIVLDHNAPPTNSKLANDYQNIRNFVKEQGIQKFYDAGKGICHQIMSYHAKPGMIIVGSDSHTCTAGAFNSMAVGIDRTESAAIWKKSETWFRVPESMKIILNGKLRPGVYAKDLSLWIIGMIGSDGANYLSIEYHGDGLEHLTVSDRMTLANLASEMGAKNAVFPPDKILLEYFGENVKDGKWADHNAHYQKILEINLDEIFPVVAVPHHVDHIKAVSEMLGTPVHQGLIGTCTNGRLEDIREAAKILDGKKVAENFQLLVIPASREIYLDAMKDGSLASLVKAGANILSSSCGPCLGTGQGIPSDGMNVLSTANRNFRGRMGNPDSSIYLASPATVAMSAINGKIMNSVTGFEGTSFPFSKPLESSPLIRESEKRKYGNVWNYADMDNLNTDLMFAGNLTYNISSNDPELIIPHLFAGFDPNFSENVKKDDIILAGHNFGCGSSREHPSVGLAYAGIKVIIAKSVNRIFYRSAINQGLVLVVLPEAVDAYRPDDQVITDFQKGELRIGEKLFRFLPLPEELMKIIEMKGLVNRMALD